MILCDTNIIIELLKGNSSIVQQLTAIGQTQIAVSAITQAELLFGARDITRDAELAKDTTLRAGLSPYTSHFRPIHPTDHKLLAQSQTCHTRRADRCYGY
ncbi:MAG: PIN domain-containing protein [Caldilineaceae bacterium]|nr:PIN domain-containing protein [Caldilineaceae bacterium]